MGTTNEPSLTRRAYKRRAEELAALRREEAVEFYEKQRALEDELDMTRDQLAETLKLLDRVKGTVGRPVAYVNGYGPTPEELNLMALGKTTQLRFLLGIDPGDVEYRGVTDE